MRIDDPDIERLLDAARGVLSTNFPSQYIKGSWMHQLAEAMEAFERVPDLPPVDSAGETVRMPFRPDPLLPGSQVQAWKRLVGR